MSQKKDKSRYNTNTDIKNLILSVRKNDQNSFVSLLEQYSPLIEASVNMFCSDEDLAGYRDDFKQEASVAFYNSILNYDLDQTNVEFGLYAKICICNALISQIRFLKRIQNEPTDEFSGEAIADDLTEDISAKIIEKENLDSLYAIIRGSLSKYEYEVWTLYVSGCSASDIASKLKTDSKSISNAIYRIRVKLRATIRQKRND